MDKNIATQTANVKQPDKHGFSTHSLRELKALRHTRQFKMKPA
jgi:hypothetical protein